MKEIRKIIERYDLLKQQGKNGALATVVKVEGSSYRRAGARMLMTEDGHWTGAISGGCLEGDALRRSRKVMLEGKPNLVTYDTTSDESAMSLGVGLGCNGIIDVLLEPLEFENPKNPLELLRNFQKNRQKMVQATVFGTDDSTEVAVGERILLHENKVIERQFKHEKLAQAVIADMQKAGEVGKSLTQYYQLAGCTITIFLEVLHPGIELMVFGSGFDAIPVVRIAHELGWEITVTDDCPAKVIPNRFPEATCTVNIPRTDILQKVKITPYSAAILMSHNYKYDISILEQLLVTDIPYIGLLGPRKRFQKMIDEYATQGKSFDYDRVHSPLGLDLGGETPEEIALSIIAEIQAFFTKHSGGFLKNKGGFIHEREVKMQERIVK
jgi:xanthine/CO dehydrogenase XdhC/CoxF family maturation factor